MAKSNVLWNKDRNYRDDPCTGMAQAVRTKCMDCCANELRAARTCAVYSCTLWPWGTAARYQRYLAKQAYRAQ